MPAQAFPATVQPLELPHAYRLLNTGGTVFIATAHAGRRNLMACAWNMALDFSPAKLALCIARTTATRALLEASGEFVVAVPRAAQADLLFTVGSRSAHELPGHDKWAAFGIDWHQAPGVVPPLPAGCIGWLACRRLPELAVEQAHDVIVGEVFAAWADTRAFAQGRFRALDDWPADWRTLHHLGAGQFLLPGQQRRGHALPVARD